MPKRCLPGRGGKAACDCQRSVNQRGFNAIPDLTRWRHRQHIGGVARPVGSRCPSRGQGGIQRRAREEDLFSSNPLNGYTVAYFESRFDAHFPPSVSRTFDSLFRPSVDVFCRSSPSAVSATSISSAQLISRIPSRGGKEIDVYLVLKAIENPRANLKYKLL